MTVFIYLRVSSRTQSDEKYGHVSLLAQEAKCREYCKKKKLGDPIVASEVVSARNMDNQQVLKRVQTAKSGDHIVVYNISRYSRNVAQGVESLNSLLQRGVTVHAVMENTPYVSHTDRFTWHVQLSNAESESQATSERVKRSIDFRKMRGDHIGTPRYGYRAVRTTENVRTILEDPNEQTVIKRIVMMIEGKSHQLEMEFNAMGFGKKPGLCNRVADILNGERVLRRGKPWTVQGVKDIYLRYVERFKDQEPDCLDEKHNGDDGDTDCVVCQNGDSEEGNLILLCDGCDKGFHQNCVNLRKIPKGNWYCGACLRKGLGASSSSSGSCKPLSQYKPSRPPCDDDGGDEMDYNVV